MDHRTTSPTKMAIRAEPGTRKEEKRLLRTLYAQQQLQREREREYDKRKSNKEIQAQKVREQDRSERKVSLLAWVLSRQLNVLLSSSPTSSRAALPVFISGL
mmetsp:Transcript_1417/g.2928  ORF Transcript_1417/g.2928 Transcript_1417/m.2928 type:complete len:102 (+) Transcript_1417:233-538(+)